MLAFGLGSISTGVLGSISVSTNVNVTIYNICAFIGAVCHLSGAYKEDRINLLLEQKRGIGIKLGISLGAVCLIVLIIIFGAAVV